MVEQLSKRFRELNAQAEQIAGTKHLKSSELRGNSYEHIDSDLILGWRVKARSLLSQACGKESEHFKSFVEAEEAQSFEDNPTRFSRVRAVFMAAKEDFEGGYLTSMKRLVEAEVFSSELEQAQELLKSGYESAAAVVCGVVLETNIRNLCKLHNIPSSSLERMNAELVKVGQYNTLVQKRITALAAIRNSAAHGNTQEFQRADVKSMIEEVERLISTWLA